MIIRIEGKIINDIDIPQEPTKSFQIQFNGTERTCSLISFRQSADGSIAHAEFEFDDQK